MTAGGRTDMKRFDDILHNYKITPESAIGGNVYLLDMKNCTLVKGDYR